MPKKSELTMFDFTTREIIICDKVSDLCYTLGKTRLYGACLGGIDIPDNAIIFIETEDNKLNKWLKENNQYS